MGGGGGGEERKRRERQRERERKKEEEMGEEGDTYNIFFLNTTRRGRAMRKNLWLSLVSSK